MNRPTRTRRTNGRTPLAWRNLTHTLGRTIVSIGGIGFAVVLMFMQLGFLGSVGETATVVFNKMPGQILVRSPDYMHVYDPGRLPNATTTWLASLPVVERAMPLDVSITQWQNPVTGGFQAVALMGVDLESPAFDLQALTSTTIARLRPVGAVLVDDASTTDLGPINGLQFTDDDIGRVADVVGNAATIAGTFEMGTGLAANGAILGSRRTFDRLMPGGFADSVSMVLIDLKDGVTLDEGLAAVRGRLSEFSGQAQHAEAISLVEAKRRERDRWVTGSPIGLIFAMGVALAVIVGGVISYMILSSDVQAHLSEYATLRAMGYSDGFLVRTLLGQSTLLALVAFPPALATAWVLYEITSALAHLPLHMTTTWIVLVLTLTLLMCNIAGALALRRLLQAEPASLF